MESRNPKQGTKTAGTSDELLRRLFDENQDGESACRSAGFPLFPQAADEEENGGDADAGVRDVEGGPPAAAAGHDLVVEWEFEEQEIHDVSGGQAVPEWSGFQFLQQETLAKAVGEVAEDAAEQQRDGDFGKRVLENALFPENPDRGKCEDRNNEEHDRRPGRAVSKTESHSLVVDAHEVEEVLHHHDPRVRLHPRRRKFPDRPELRDLVEHVERQREEEEELGESHRSDQMGDEPLQSG